MPQHDDNENGSMPQIPAGATLGSRAAPVSRDPAGPEKYGKLSGETPALFCTKKVNAVALLKALKRRWLLATCLGVVLAAAAAGGVWMFLPPAREAAYVKFLVRNKVGEVFQHPENQTDFQAYLREQAAYLKSRLVLNAALKQPNIEEAKPLIIRDSLYPVDRLAQLVKVDFLEGPHMPRLSLVLDNPEEAKLIVEAIANAYFKEVVNKEHDERVKLLAKLTKACEIQEQNVKKIKDAMRDVGKTIGAGDSKNAALRLELVMKDLRDTQSDLRKVRQELSLLQPQRAQGQDAGAASVVTMGATGSYALFLALHSFAGPGRADAPKVPEYLLDEHLAKDPRIAELMGKIAKSETLLHDTRERVVRADDPAVRRIQDQLTLQRDELDSLRKQLRPGAEAHLRERMSPTSTDPAQRQARIALLKQQKEDLEKDFENLQKEARELNTGGINLDDFREDRDLANKIATYLAEQRDQLAVDLNVEPRVRLLEPASIERIEELPRKLRFAGLAALAALAVTLLGVSFLEFRRHRVDSPETVVQTLGMNLVGTVPAFPSRLRRFAEGDQKALHWQHVLTDSVDAARTMLVHLARSNRLSSVMITSAVSGEGKTSLASHLAISMVRAGYKTLLIDCDFRNPAMHQLFELALAPGFCELLRGECTAAQALRPTSAEGLSFISAGQLDPAALRLLAQRRGRDLLDQLRTEFEFVVVDSSPILPVADALLVAQLVDGALLSVLCDISRLPRVHDAYARLTTLGVNVLGAVVNGAADDHSDYGYGKYYTSSGRSLNGEKP